MTYPLDRTTWGDRLLWCIFVILALVPLAGLVFGIYQFLTGK